MRQDASYKPADMNEIVSLPYWEILPDVDNHIKDAVSRYAVGLIILNENNDILSLASGTFVSLRGRLAILTACHIINKIKYNLGLAFDYDDLVHKPVLERGCLEFACAPMGAESKEPDMGLIYINDRSMLGTIKAIKSFFNLDCDADSIREKIAIPTAPTICKNIRECQNTGILCVSGLPGEWSDIKSNIKSLTQVVFFPGAYYYSERDGYDYFDVDFTSPHPGRVPSSLRGLSGGGVWHAKVLYNKTTGKVYVPTDLNWLILSGIGFGESPVIHGGRSLRTHGPKSIYVKLFEWA